MTKVRELKITDPAKCYEIDTKFVLTNHHGKEVRETIRSTTQKDHCKLFLCQTYGERCSNCTTLLQTKNIFRDNKKQPNKCNSDSHTAISKHTFQELLERYKNVKKIVRLLEIKNQILYEKNDSEATSKLYNHFNKAR